jgi:2,4-dienoyl-CoA reductase-like NADH-dependent reductase (Old Yellow Enzyme family)
VVKLFEATKMGDLLLPNRFIRSATWEGLASETGQCTPELLDLMVALARGGVGLIFTGHAYVDSGGQATPRQLAANRDDCVDGLGVMTEAVHREGGRIMMQLSHAGLMADPGLTGIQPSGPSSGEGMVKAPGLEMTIDQIQKAAEAFGKAARRAKEAGFDGVQIHAAHGYLLSQFLSPAYNRRNDEYGGSFENRARLTLEVVRGVRLTVGRYYPVLVKINSEDFLDKGLTVEEFIKTGSLLVKAGVNAIEVSGGTVLSKRLVPFRKALTFERDQAYFRKAARALKARVKAPVILVGGIRSYHVAERMVDEGIADYISMSRPFIREPMLIKRWQAGDLRKASCISCNACLASARSKEGLYCVEERKISSRMRPSTLGS